MELVKQFGRNVRRVRLERGMTQDVLAADAGIFRDHLSNIEHGKANPTLRTIGRIAEALALPLAELVRPDVE